MRQQLLVRCPRRRGDARGSRDHHHRYCASLADLGRDQLVNVGAELWDFQNTGLT